MKTIITILCINLFVLFFSDCSTAQNPTYNVTAKNFITTDSIGDRRSSYDAVSFDIFIEHTNVGVSGPFEFALGQYYLNLNSAFCTTADYAYFIVPGSTTFTNTNAVPRNPTYVSPDATSPSGASLRVNSNTVLGAGSGPIVSSVFPGTRVCTMKFKKKVGSFPIVEANMIWRIALPNPFSKVFAYVGTTSTDISANGDFNCMGDGEFLIYHLHLIYK
ncbi:MAG: hypothetical protein IPL16_18145 [Ignavibacteria bacterium]|nr:hypothetical protein [Ignavibacteria bacterium]